MELPSKLLETIAFNTRSKIEEHMLIVMDKSIHEENLSQPLQTNNKQFKIAVTFLTTYNGIFNITSKNNKFYFVNPANEIIMITIPPGAYELESLNEEIKRIIIEEEYITEDFYPFSGIFNGIYNITHENNKFYYLTPINMLKYVTLPKGNYAVVHETKEDDIISFHTKIKGLIIKEGGATESNYPFVIIPNFDNLGSIIEIADGWEIDFNQDETIREVLGFKSKRISNEINNSDYPVDIISFDNIFIETDIALGMLINSKRSGIIHIFTMDVDHGYGYIEKFRSGITWYMMESKDFISDINFKLKNEHNKLVSFNGQSITFRLTIKEV